MKLSKPKNDFSSLFGKGNGDSEEGNGEGEGTGIGTGKGPNTGGGVGTGKGRQVVGNPRYPLFLHVFIGTNPLVD